jgi:hypothetical protein
MSQSREERQKHIGGRTITMLITLHAGRDTEMLLITAMSVPLRRGRNPSN